ncbi:MAG: UDP-3-O-(3-hydroxymyristoyl)glucosamine N-acyltransferase [Gemmatimonadetes bacterium]|nr:UDP-3-O-(3-hydroxymyristoyl)glucosamine N-acyltransferase [Gemmatimonadota bacterium]
MTPEQLAPTMTAAQLAEATGGRLVGDPAATVRAIAPLDRAGPEDLSFLAILKYAPMLATTRAGVVLVAPELQDVAGAPRARVIVAKPHEAMLRLIPSFYRPSARTPGIHAAAHVSPQAVLGRDVCIDAGAVIEDGARIGDRTWIGAHSVVGAGATLGSDCQLHPQATVYPNSELGDRVILHSGARIGSDGFGYVSHVVDGAFTHQKIPHIGRAILGDDVEIGANSAVDRGSIDDTVVGAGTKIDNLVHIGHNARIGRLCLLVAQCGVSGSSRVEDGVVLAGQVGVSGHLTIGAGAKVGAQGGVISDIPPGETWSGYPARPHRESLRASAALFKLAGMMKRLERLLDKDDA